MSNEVIWNRIYSDFFMPSRLGVYQALLQEVLNRGYEVHSVASFWQLIKEGRLRSCHKYLVLRHDIDTDTETARAMWEIEKDLGIKASYYFRLSTLDILLMTEIHQWGSEASYHYEEIATVAKQKHLKSVKQVLREMPFIRELFAENLLSLREKTGLPMSIVASHGDFVNRKLDIGNLVILQDQALRQKLGIELEVYDDAMMKYVTSRHSDTLYPRFWEPDHPLQAIERRERVIYILTHPRQWRVHFKINFMDNLKRIWEGIRFTNPLTNRKLPNRVDF